MSKQAIRRVLNVDRKMIQELDLESQGIYVRFEEENILNAYAMMIGPQGTPYEDCMLCFKIVIPTDYPFSPPHVTYVSLSNIRIHPNLYVGKSYQKYEGKVCLSVINTWSGPKWTSVMTIASVLLSLQSLLDENPLRNEPGYEKVEGHQNEVYNMLVEHDMLQRCYLDHLISLKTDYTESIYPYEMFTTVMKEHFQRSAGKVRDRVHSLTGKHPNKLECKIGVYRICDTIDYKKMGIKFDEIQFK